jgi:hypothetical protein
MEEILPGVSLPARLPITTATVITAVTTTVTTTAIAAEVAPAAIAIFAWLGFIDFQSTATEIFAIELINSCCSFRV